MARKAVLVLWVACLCLAWLTTWAAAGERILTIYTWEEYFSPDVLAQFEREHNCRIELSHYDSNETLVESLRSGGGYDIVTPSGIAADQLRELGALLPLDHARLPNLANHADDHPPLSHDVDMRYMVPYTLTITGVAYDRRAVSPDGAGSWSIFGDFNLSKRMTMLNEGREALGAALKYLGYSLNSTSPAELREAAKLLGEWKRNLALFALDEAREGLRVGRFAAIQTYNGDFAMIQGDNPHLAFFVPREGTAINSDQLVICADAEYPDLAHEFINFIYRPEIAARNMQDIGYYMPNKAGLELLGDKYTGNPAFNIPREVLENCEVLTNISAAQRLYDEAWEGVLLD